MYEANKSVSYDKCTVFSYGYVTIRLFASVAEENMGIYKYNEYRQTDRYRQSKHIKLSTQFNVQCPCLTV